jgi:ABC-type lipoprotein export system ATPase subunit
MIVEGMFGIDAASKSTTVIPANIPDLSSRDWNVGLIVGPSGAGKSTVARELFQQQMLAQESLSWSNDKALVDEFPADMKIQDVTTLLSSVGFSSPPAWLRPFSALSNGEQFRVSMARLLAEQPELAVVDEFTSVVDRTVAQIGSHAIAKTVRRRNQKFVAVTCHFDVAEWLQPDWTYEPATGTFRWESLHRRPSVNLEVFRSDAKAWQTFRRHHYLSEQLPNNGKIFVGTVNGQPAAFCCVVPFPHPTLKNAYRIARSVVIPDFQGIGVGRDFTDAIAGGFKAAGKTVISTTGHPQMIRARLGSKAWKMTAAPRRTPKQGKSSTMKTKAVASNRLVASFKYVGEPNLEMLPLVVE